MACHVPSIGADGNRQTRKEKIMNSIEIDQTMMTGNMPIAVEIDEQQMMSPMDRWSYETMLLKCGAD